MGKENQVSFLTETINFCHLNLLQKSSKLALAYLVSRGITLDEIKKYRIGYIGNSLANVSDTEDLDAANFNKWLGYKGKFVKYRIVFPIWDELGNPKGIETRSLDIKSMGVLLPKYKHLLEETSIPTNEVRYKKFYLDKSKFSACYFGLPSSLEFIWEKKELFLTEGIFDCLSLLKIFPNCLSSLTANLNKYQIDWLKRYVKKVILIFDMDKKGQESVAKIKDLVGEELYVYSIQLKNKDINETILKNGVKELKWVIENKLSSFF